MFEPTADFEKFYIEWRPTFEKIGSELGLKNEDLDDAVADTFRAIWEGDYLLRYNEGLASFKTYIYSQALGRMRNHFRDYVKRMKRGDVPIIITMEYGEERILDEADKLEDVDWDAVGGAHELVAIIRSTHELLTRYPSSATKDLARLFRDVIIDIDETGELNQSRLAEKYGLTRQALGQQIKHLRATRELIILRNALMERVD